MSIRDLIKADLEYQKKMKVYYEKKSTAGANTTKPFKPLNSQAKLQKKLQKTSNFQVKMLDTKRTMGYTSMVSSCKT